MLKDYVKKERLLGKNESKLMEAIMKNQETIRNMDTYCNQEIQTEEESNVENQSLSLQDNSLTNSLYPSGY